MIKKGGRDYIIRYVDNDLEAINISDDEDLTTAYEVAEQGLNGNIKLIVEFRKLTKSVSKTVEKNLKNEEKKKVKKEKKEKKEKNKTLKKQDKEEIKMTP